MTIYRIDDIERLANSVNGNPRFRFHLSTDTNYVVADSKSDASFNYEVGNPGLRAGNLVDVTFTRSGRIRFMRGVS